MKYESLSKKRTQKPTEDQPFSKAQQAHGPVPPAPKSMIRFDRKTLILLGTLFLLLCVLTGLRVNGSSVGCWNRFLGQEPAGNTIFGAPKPIRSDEWAIHTPAILSQVNSRKPFPDTNYSLGALKAPLVMNLPVAHFSTLFRPQFWLFFITDVETAFSFYWNMKFVFVIGGLFFLLMVLLRNNFYVALFGALWVFFSGYTQWWYSSPQLWPELVGCFAFCTTALICMLLSQRKIEIVVSSLVFISCSFNFALFLYPPHQIPFVYLSCALVLGVLIAERRNLLNTCLKDRFRWVCIGGALCVVVGSLFIFYLDAGETLRTLSMTVYPGRRRVQGGELSLLQMFNGFLGPFMSEGHLPSMWGNICESSNFFLFFPILMVVLGYRLWKRGKATPVEISLAAFMSVLAVWDLVGFPELLAKCTLFDRVTPGRTYLSLGVASIIWTCVFVDSGLKGGFKVGPRFSAVVPAAALLGICLYTFQFNKVSDNFLPAYQAILLCAFVAASTYLLVRVRPLFFAVLVLVPNMVFHGLVNPVSVGLAPILKNPVYNTTADIVRHSPEDKWIVYAPLPWLPDIVYAAGAKVFDGLKWVPDLNEVGNLSADPKDVSVYNRYAYISIYPWNRPDIRFVVGESPDTYTIFAHPLNEHWRRLDITYYVFPFPLKPEIARTAFQQTWRAGPFFIYKYKAATQ